MGARHLVWLCAVAGCTSRLGFAPPPPSGAPCVSAADCAAGESCGADGTCVAAGGGGELCAGVSCSGFGTCVLVGGSPQCDCLGGYSAVGLSCVEDGCTPTAHASAACDQGDLYWYDSCGGREELQLSCGGFGCADAACNPDPCAGVSCSGFGSCVASGGSPQCNCFSGYTAVALSCVAEGCSPTSHAYAACDQGDVHWFDSCGGREDLRASCAGAGCLFDQCGPSPWQTLGGSASTEHLTTWKTGSGSGDGISLSPFGAGPPSLILDAGGRPIVAWAIDTWDGSYSAVHVRRWDGVAWVELGEGSATGGGVSGWYNTGDPVLALDAGGAPILVTTVNYEVYAWRFSSGVWTEVTPGSASGGGISNSGVWNGIVKVAAGGDGSIWVAWQSDLAYCLHVRVLVGGVWAEAAGSASGCGLTPAGEVYALDLALDSQDRPYLVWEAPFGTYTEIYVRYYDGTSWAELAGSGSGGGLTNDDTRQLCPAITVDDLDRPVVVYTYRSSSSDWLEVWRFDGTAWVQLGNPGFGPVGGIDIYYLPTITTNAAGEPVVAWGDSSNGNYEICLREYDGTTFQSVGPGGATTGGISNSPGDSTYPALVRAADGSYVVAWLDASPAQTQVYVEAVTASAAAELGAAATAPASVSQTIDYSSAPAIALDGSGNPWLAWQEREFVDTDVFVRAFDGTAWVEYGGSASGAGLSNDARASDDPDLAVASDGTAYIVWNNQTSQDREIFGMRNVGGTFSAIGNGSASGAGISSNTTSSTQPRVALDAAELPVVVWAENTGGSGGDYSTYVKRFDGTAWVEVSTGSASGTGLSGADYAFEPVIATRGTELVVAWTVSNAGNSIHVRRFDGTSFVDVGPGASAPLGVTGNAASREPRIAIDPAGRVVLAYSDWTSGYPQIHVRRFDGTGWAEVGAGSATAGGISDSWWMAHEPTLALDATGEPVVAWTDVGYGASEIYLKRFDGAAWTDIFVSAVGPGVSNSATNSRQPSLATRGNRLCVAWSEMMLTSFEIVARCATY